MNGETDQDIASRMVAANDLEFHVLEAGSGDPVLFLHGFPDHAGIWRNIMQRLAPRFHVIAPDQRGYNLSSRPKGVDAYRTPRLVDDMIGLLDAMGVAQAAVCGHDWGGIIGFHLAMQHPDRVSKLIVLNSVHPYLFQTRIWDDPEQRAASQYFRKLQTGKVPSAFTEEGCGALIDEWFSKPLTSGQMTMEEVQAYRKAWTQPGVWRAMINWYRASGYDVPKPEDPAPERRWTDEKEFTLSQPLLVVWGQEDRVFVRGLTTSLAPYVEDLKICWLDGVGHVPQREDPARCAKEIVNFLSPSAQ